MVIWGPQPLFWIPLAYAFQNRVTNFPKKEWTSSTWELGRAGHLVNGTVVWTKLSRANSLQYTWSVRDPNDHGLDALIDKLYFLLVVFTPSKGSDLVLPCVSFTLPQRIKAIWGTFWPPWSSKKALFSRKFLFFPWGKLWGRNTLNFPWNIRGRVQWSRWWVITIHLEKPKI